jgi:hypothetical protein
VSEKRPRRKCGHGTREVPVAQLYSQAGQSLHLCNLLVVSRKNLGRLEISVLGYTLFSTVRNSTQRTQKYGYDQMWLEFS